MAKLFFITSCINTPPYLLPNGTKRTVYSDEERYEQTLETIASIRINEPDAYIAFLEFNTLEFDKENNIRRLIYDPRINDSLFSSAENFHKDVPIIGKSYAEALRMHSAVRDTFQLVKDQKIDYICKLSGRYRLDPIHYRPATFSGEHVIMKKAYTNGINKWYQTVLWGWHPIHHEYMALVFERALSFCIQGYDIETSMCASIDPSIIKEVNTVGAYGNLAPTGEFVEY